MSKYTVTIKNLIKNKFDFGLIDYPIFDENYRSVLNQNILYAYYEEEIGFETPELFKVYLNRTMNRIMPYYNNLYLAQKELIEKGLFNNANYKETIHREVDSESTSKGKGLFQDTPQGKISMTEFEDQEYATNLNLTNDNTNGNSVENYVREIVGNNGNRYPADIFIDFANKLINIDDMIINDLQDLFMGIF